MTEATTRRRNHGYAATRQQIIDAARQLMREEGVGALSLHEVARRVGMKAPSLYTYFESKHALYDQIFRLGMQQYRAEVNAAAQEAADGPEALDAAVTHALHFADANPELFSLLFERPVPGFEPFEESMEEARGLLDDGARYLQRLVDAGAIRPPLPVEQARDILIVLIQGLTSLKRANEPGAPPGEGRFGPLVPHVVALLKNAWIPGEYPASREEDQ